MNIPPSAKKLSRRIGFGFLIFAGVAVSLMAVLVFFAESEHGKAWILGKLNTAIPGSLSVESLEFRIWKGDIDIGGVKLNDAGGKAIAGVNKISVDFSWTSLSDGNAGFTSLVIHKPWLDIRKDADGQYNIRKAIRAGSATKTQSAAGKKLPLNLVFQSIGVNGGRVAYFQESDGLAATIEGIDIAGNANIFLRKARVSVSVSDIRVQKSEKSFDIGAVKATAELKASRIEQLVVRVTGPSAGMNLTARIDDIFSSPLWSLEVNGDLLLEPISEFVPILSKLSGKMEFSASLQGDMTDPGGSLEFSYNGGRLAGMEVESASGNLDLKERNLTVSGLEIRTASGQTRVEGEISGASAFGNGMFRPPTDLKSIAYRLSVKQQHLDLNSVIPEARGIVDADIEFSGKGLLPESLSAKTVASARARQLSVNQNVAPVDMALNVRADYNAGLVHIENLDASAGDLRLQLQGKVDLSTLELDSKINLKASDLTSSLAPLGIQDVRGGISLEADVSGFVTRPVFHVSGQGKNLNFKKISFGEVKINAAMASTGILEVTDLSVDNRGSVVRGSGRIRIFDNEQVELIPPDLDFKASLRHIEIQDFYPWSGVTGTFGAEIRMTGALKDMKASAILQGRQVKILEKYNLGEAEADLDWNAGRLKVNHLESDNGQSELTVSGSLQLLKPGTFSGLRQPLMDNARLTGTLELGDLFSGLSGAVGIDARLGGRLLRPSGAVELTSEAVRTPVQTFNEVRVSGGLTETTVAIERLQALTAPGESLSASGELNYDGRFSIRLDADGISTAHLNAFDDQNIFGGRLFVSARGAGHLSNPTLTARIRLEDVTVNQKPLDAFSIAVDLKDQMAQLEGRLNFDVRGRYHLQKKDFSLSARFDQTELSPYLRLIDRPDVSGTLTGQVTASGNASHPESVSANAELTDITLVVKGLKAVNTGTLKGEYAGGKVNLKDLHLTILDRGWVRATGGGELNRDLNLRAEGEIPFAIVKQFTKSIQTAEGNVAFSAGLKGPLAKPAIEGVVELEDLGFTTDQWFQKIHHVSGKINATPKAVVISDLSGNLDAGRFFVQGEAVLADLFPQQVKIHFTGDSLPIKVPDTLNVSLNTDLTFSGTPENTRMDGDVVLVGGEYTKDVRMQLLGGAGKRERPSTSADRSFAFDAPFLRQVDLNVAIKRRTPFRVDNNIAELEISPDLLIGGTLARPTVSGRTNIDSGVIKYQKRTFTVTKGSVDFLNPYGIEPTISLESQTSIRSWDIFLYLSGTPEEMNLKLTSEPEEEQADIVSLLLFRKTSAELISSEGGFTGSTERMLASMIESTWGEDIRSATGLDIFSVDASDTGQNANGNEGVKVTLGKELTNRLTLKYEAASGSGEMNQRAIAEYKLLENLMVSGFQEDGSRFGGELQFRLEFR